MLFSSTAAGLSPSCPPEWTTDHSEAVLVLYLLLPFVIHVICGVDLNFETFYTLMIFLFIRLYHQTLYGINGNSMYLDCRLSS